MIERRDGEGMTEFTMRRIRAEIIEECAKVVEQYGLERVNDVKDYPASVAAACSYRIRCLVGHTLPEDQRS